MNAQEVFNKVVTHLFTQKKPSMDEAGGSCLYRGVKGTMCAVGALIPDAIYNEKMEYNAVDNLISRFGDILPAEIKEHRDLLKQLQLVHDNNSCNLTKRGTFMKVDLKKSLKEVAVMFNLNDDILKGF